MTARDVIADEVARIDSDGSDGSKTEADRILAALADAGYAVVELPEPDRLRHTGLPEWGVVEARVYVDARWGVSWVGRFEPEYAVPFAAALLAAAAYAERGGQR